MIKTLSKRLFSTNLPSSFPKQLLINNKFVNSVKGDTFATIDPSTGKEICQVARAGKEDVDLAVSAAKTAFE